MKCDERNGGPDATSSEARKPTFPKVLETLIFVFAPLGCGHAFTVTVYQSAVDGAKRFDWVDSK